jgi:hypothetical protein
MTTNQSSSHAQREVMEEQGLGAWKPVERDRRISGAVRDVSGLRR